MLAKCLAWIVSPSEFLFFSLILKKAKVHFYFTPCKSVCTHLKNLHDNILKIKWGVIQINCESKIKNVFKDRMLNLKDLFGEQVCCLHEWFMILQLLITEETNRTPVAQGFG